MKTLKTIFSAFATLSIFISLTILGCTKEKDETNQLPKGDIHKSGAPVMELLYVIRYNGEIIWCICDSPPYNCLPPVIITPSKSPGANAYTQFIQAFTNNDTRKFFSSDASKFLFPNLQLLPDAVLGLQNGEIVLHYIKGTNDNFDYYVGLPKEVDFNSEWDGMEKCVLVIDNSLR